MISDIVEASGSLIQEGRDLLVQGMDNLHRLVDRRLELATVALPAGDAFHFLLAAAILCGDLVAECAFLAHGKRVHDKLHATRFTTSVFAVAMLAEIAPFPVATFETILIVVAHSLKELRLSLPSPTSVTAASASRTV